MGRGRKGDDGGFGCIILIGLALLIVPTVLAGKQRFDAFFGNGFMLKKEDAVKELSTSSKSSFGSSKSQVDIFIQYDGFYIKNELRSGSVVVDVDEINSSRAHLSQTRDNEYDFATFAEVAGALARGETLAGYLFNNGNYFHPDEYAVDVEATLTLLDEALMPYSCRISELESKFSTFRAGTTVRFVHTLLTCILFTVGWAVFQKCKGVMYIGWAVIVPLKIIADVLEGTVYTKVGQILNERQCGSLRTPSELEWTRKMPYFIALTVVTLITGFLITAVLFVARDELCCQAWKDKCGKPAPAQPPAAPAVTLATTQPTTNPTTSPTPTATTKPVTNTTTIPYGPPTDWQPPATEPATVNTGENVIPGGNTEPYEFRV